MSVSEISRESFAGAGRRDESFPDADAFPPFPVVAPGQLWLIELPAGSALSVQARQVLDGADVVIYDRALADTVANALPLGTYAEPVTHSAASPSRCVRFARDGWSVARLMPAGLPRRERTRQVQDIVDELAAAKVAGRLLVSILAESADGSENRFQTRFDDLASTVAYHPSDALLAIAIDAFGVATTTRLHAVGGNGLAG